MNTSKWRTHLIIVYAAAMLLTIALQLLFLLPSLRTQETNINDRLQLTRTVAAANLVDIQLHHLGQDLEAHSRELAMGETTSVLDQVGWAVAVGVYDSADNSVRDLVTDSSHRSMIQFATGSGKIVPDKRYWDIPTTAIIIDDSSFLLISCALTTGDYGFAIADVSWLANPQMTISGLMENSYIATTLGQIITHFGADEEPFTLATLSERYSPQTPSGSLLKGQQEGIDLMLTDNSPVHVVTRRLDNSNLILVMEHEPLPFGTTTKGASTTVLLLSMGISALMLILLGLGAFFPIREQRSYEHQLREERDRSQQYLDVSSVILLALDKNKRITMINRTGASLLGYRSPGELVGRNWLEFIPDDDKTIIESIFANLLKAGSRRYSEVEGLVLTKTGETKLIVWNNKIMRRSDGTISGTLSSGRDVTELRMTQKSHVESERKLGLALEGANLGTWEYDPGTGIYTLGTRALDMLGYDQEEMKQCSLISLLHEEDQARALDVMECHTSGLSPWYSIDFRIRDHSGTYRWVRAMGQRFKISHGQYIVHGVLRDISESRKAKEALAYHTQFEELLLERFSELLSCPFDQVDTLIKKAIGSVSSLIKAETAVLFPNLADTLYVQALTLNGSRVIDDSDAGPLLERLAWLTKQTAEHPVVSVESVDKLTSKADELKAALKEKGVESLIALPLKARTGDDALLLFCNIREPYAWDRKADEPLMLLADMISSAYQRQAYEAELIRFRTLAENANYGVCILDPDWKTTYVNPCFERLHGFSAGECLGRPVEQYHAPGRVETVQECKRMLIEQGGFVRDDLTHVRQDGSVFPVFSNCTMIRDESGAPLFSALSVTDISERTEFIRQLEQSSEEVRRANDELRQFTYIVSHDMRSPLVNLKGFGQELRFSIADLEPTIREAIMNQPDDERNMLTDVLEKDIPESLSFIERSVSNMDDMVNALLRLSRMGRRELTLEEIDTRRVVEDALAAVAHQLAVHNGETAVDDLPFVIADRTSFSQIIGNLIGNAVKYLTDDRPARIHVSAEQQDEYWIFHISDNGIGIAKRDFDNVLAPFRRVGKQDVPGEGMGLPYVQALVRRHGGELWFESELGVGSAFSFSLPMNKR